MQQSLSYLPFKRVLNGLVKFILGFLQPSTAVSCSHHSGICLHDHARLKMMSRQINESPFIPGKGYSQYVSFATPWIWLVDEVLMNQKLICVELSLVIGKVGLRNSSAFSILL